MGFGSHSQIASRDDAIAIARMAGRSDGSGAAAQVARSAMRLDEAISVCVGPEWAADLRLTAEYLSAYSQAFDARLAALAPESARVRAIAQESLIEDAISEH